jgi:hypothetical protein
MSNKAERQMSVSIACFIAFVALTVISNFLSFVIYLAIVAGVLSAFFFFNSVRFMGEKDLFELIGSVLPKKLRAKSRQQTSALPPPPAAEIKCPKCGFSVKPNANFCENCGAKMSQNLQA